jgi:hypothetical protein
MSLVRCIVLVVQAVLTGVAGVMSLWVGLPEATPIGLGLVGISAMAVTTPQLRRRKHVERAANDRTDPDIVKFYELGFPAAAWQIQANLVHSVIVQQLATQHPEVCLVDTRPRLDGNPDLFIDLVHFAPAGDQEMAEVFFAALRPVLEEDLRRFARGALP